VFGNRGADSLGSTGDDRDSTRKPFGHDALPFSALADNWSLIRCQLHLPGNTGYVDGSFSSFAYSQIFSSIG